ncbi:MAG: hypothetical protein JRI97_10425 [Deltaproteobacteria bacterium]|nr:hypothetical protein [Deltaproteobacteria bacterium]
MLIPKEIEEAKDRFEKAEVLTDPNKKAEELNEGLDLIELYLEDNPNCSPDIKQYIKNLKRAHTRVLLRQLTELPEVDMETWINYIILFAIKLKDVVDYVTKNDDYLRKIHDEFWEIHRDEFIKLARRAGY